MKSFPDLENIYTHNANGEYGHPDHKSVHQAVTAAYAQEYNLCFLSKLHNLSKSL